jgi:homoserine kinase type II
VYRALPHGPIHADLFRNNVMFNGDQLGGFFDFYFAGCDTWLFDVAVAVNDWCIAQESGQFVPELLQAWLTAYAAVRPFTAAERQAWVPMLRAAALRFWLSRLYDAFLPRPAQALKAHDPRHFERILQARRQASLSSLP